MKIVEVNTYTVRPRWGFVEIVTDEGLTGWGEPVIEIRNAVIATRSRICCLKRNIVFLHKIQVVF